MNTLQRLEKVKGRGTSMITMTISTNISAFVNATALLKREYAVSANIKSRVSTSV